MKIKNPVNVILVAISFIIFGALGLVFITQMELAGGFYWEKLSDRYAIELDVQLTSDLNSDGSPDLICNAYTSSYRPQDSEISDNRTTYGALFSIDPIKGSTLWIDEYDTPVFKVMPIGDVDGDGIEDFFVNMKKVEKKWIPEPNATEPRYITQVVHDKFTNKIISGIDGDEFPIPTGNFTNNLITDVIQINNLEDDVEDLIILEGKYSSSPFESYQLNISTYFINCTRKNTFFVDSADSGLRNAFRIPRLIQFDYSGEPHALFISYNRLILFNASSANLLDVIYSKSGLSINHFAIIEDINLDTVPEIATISYNGTVDIFSGRDGNLVMSFTVSTGDSERQIIAVGSLIDDEEAYILTTRNIQIGDERSYSASVHLVTMSTHEVIWEFNRTLEEDEDTPACYVLHEDLTGDSIEEIIQFMEYDPLFAGSQNVRRYRIIDATNNMVLEILNIEYHGQYLITIPDLDQDGKRDFTFSEGDRIIGLSSQKPLAIWISPIFGFGIPLFILLIILLGAGFIMLVANIKKVKPKRERLKQSKLAIFTNVIVIALMAISFILFALMLNIFNRTLIIGDGMTGLTIIYLTITIVWFGLLPFTAALYNYLSPRYAYGFIALRNLFFKFSRSYNHTIFRENLKHRYQLSTMIRLKRVVLPLLLSISIGFYSYNTLAPLLGYPQGFDIFGGQKFFQFMIGYNLLCLLPMILTFIAFSFFISGNYLLDDAGISYYLESKKYRRPGDIEPISVWSQSLIKGIAGFSAIITFASFFITVDFSGFFTNEDNALMMSILGIFIITVMFWGAPFLTSLAYILFAVEIMDYSCDFNSEKLYTIMEKHGYDTTPRELTNLFPNGYDLLKKNKIPEDERRTP
jgi:hypothetical protein